MTTPPKISQVVEMANQRSGARELFNKMLDLFAFIKEQNDKIVKAHPDDYHDKLYHPFCIQYRHFRVRNRPVENDDEPNQDQEPNQVEIHDTRHYIPVTIGDFQELINNNNIPFLHQHYYEVIQEGAPCVFYLDVEKQIDKAEPLPVPVSVDSAIKSKTFKPDDANARDCPVVCSASCTAEFANDSGFTRRVMIEELVKFSHEQCEFKCVDDAEVIRIFFEADNIIVLNSHSDVKFSQHYIVRFNKQSMLFANNKEVKEVVNLFISYLYERATESRRVHTALFYHEQAPDMTGSDTNNSVFNLKCIIDQSVYTKNRLFRCLNSCKLGPTRSPVFKLDASHEKQPPPPEATLVSKPLISTTLDIIEKVTFSGANTTAPDSTDSSVSTTARNSFDDGYDDFNWSPAESRQKLPVLCQATLDAQRDLYIKASIFPRPTFITGATISVPKNAGTNYCVFVDVFISGSRFCSFVSKEHKQNRVYWRYCYNVYNRTESASVMQLCFNDICRFVGRKRIPVDPSVTSELRATLVPLVNERRGDNQGQQQIGTNNNNNDNTNNNPVAQNIQVPQRTKFNAASSTQQQQQSQVASHNNNNNNNNPVVQNFHAPQRTKFNAGTSTQQQQSQVASNNNNNNNNNPVVQNFHAPQRTKFNAGTNTQQQQQSQVASHNNNNNNNVPVVQNFHAPQRTKFNAGNS